MGDHHVSEDGRWYWDGQRWRPVQRESLIDSARGWLWVAAGPILGAGSLAEHLATSWYHPWVPLLGFAISVISLAAGLALHGATRAAMVGLGVIGLLLNVVAGLLVLSELGR